MPNLDPVVARLNVPVEALEFYGRDKAKFDLFHPFFRELLQNNKTDSKGKLILVTAINPTPAGEGKTTTSIGLGDALNRLGKSVAICLREPSLGPCFGVKGGAIGGGRARLYPAAEINLHFTGDFHAITTAHNLIAAVLDNALHHQTLGRVNPKKITWRRVMDMNDRALRHIAIGLGGAGEGVMRESGFDITAASEIMALLCLAHDQNDLRQRLDRIVLGWQEDHPLTVKDLNVTGALMALLKDALKPNLVQTEEGTPVIIHGGPFGNIAHGCNSLMATKTALSLADWVVTEAGFGADLGAEKFFNIKCRTGALQPACAVVVATVRALKYNGGVSADQLGVENVPALEYGMANLIRHCTNIEQFGVPVVVALNRFDTDTDTEIETLQAWCRRNRVSAVVCRHFTLGGEGALDLAEKVMAKVDEGGFFKPLYPDSLSLLDKIEVVCKRIYHADEVEFSANVRDSAARFEKAGYGALPVCIAKTQYSFSDDPKKLGAPKGFTMRIQELRLSAGAGFVVAIMQNIALMPGLPIVPASGSIDLDPEGNITGIR